MLLNSKRYNPLWPHRKTKVEIMQLCVWNYFPGSAACYKRLCDYDPLSSLHKIERLLVVSARMPNSLVFWLFLALCMRLASARVWVGAVVRRMGLGTLPAVLMAPDCLCAGRMKQAPAGRGAVKRITPALTYPCMVYHPVAKYSYCIWRRRRRTTSGRNRRWSFGREPQSYSPYFRDFN